MEDRKNRNKQSTDTERRGTYRPDGRHSDGKRYRGGKDRARQERDTGDGNLCGAGKDGNGKRRGHAGRGEISLQGDGECGEQWSR